MSRKTKIWLIVAASLIGLGCIILGGAMTVLNWDFTKLGTMQYETNSHAIDQAIVDIKVMTKTADVIIRPSGEEEISVICDEQTRAKHTVAIKDGVLEIRMEDERKWYDYIGINFRSPGAVWCFIGSWEYGQGKHPDRLWFCLHGCVCVHGKCDLHSIRNGRNEDQNKHRQHSLTGTFGGCLGAVYHHRKDHGPEGQLRRGSEPEDQHR